MQHTHTILMQVKDDGKGFVLSKQENGHVIFGGNGLYNMQKRAKELKGKIKIDSAVEKGTLISLEFIV